MCSPAAPDHSTPSSTPLGSTATMPPIGAEALDPLVAQTAKEMAVVINHFKCELDKRDSTWANVNGTLVLALQSQTFELTIVPDKDGGKYPVSVRATLQRHNATNGAPLPSTNSSSTYNSMRRNSDAELERDLVSWKKRKLEEDGDTAHKRPRTDDDDDDEDVMSLITKEDLNHLLVKLREDIQEDTSECVNHVQRLLRRFKEEWHEKTRWDEEQAQTRQTRRPFRESIANDAFSRAAFPSLSVDRDDQNTSISDVVRGEAKLISSQIKWVEDCRRVAADIHDKREEIWRTSSAAFHDRQRQDRENFQNKLLHESGMHSQALTQILNEVKAIGLYTQSLKWEMPTSHLTYPSASVPTPPALSHNPHGQHRVHGQGVVEQ